MPNKKAKQRKMDKKKRKAAIKAYKSKKKGRPGASKY
tara:strand:+ start:333 stop:443 length:111 start_codon:yes stop_codon:yes gene_type:complete